jgi:hypothetical protein
MRVALRTGRLSGVCGPASEARSPSSWDGRIVRRESHIDVPNLVLVGLESRREYRS